MAGTLAATLVAVAGCSSMALIAPPQSRLEGGVDITFKKATLADGLVVIRIVLMNEGRETLELNLRQWALRLPDGRLLPPDPDDEHYTAPVVLFPRTGVELCVRFPVPGGQGAELDSVFLVVGGVRVGAEEEGSHVVGEIPFHASGRRGQ